MIYFFYENESVQWQRYSDVCKFWTTVCLEKKLRYHFLFHTIPLGFLINYQNIFCFTTFHYFCFSYRTWHIDFGMCICACVGCRYCKMIFVYNKVNRTALACVHTFKHFIGRDFLRFCIIICKQALNTPVWEVFFY